jgi:hypothetical protein
MKKARFSVRVADPDRPAQGGTPLPSLSAPIANDEYSRVQPRKFRRRGGAVRATFTLTRVCRVSQTKRRLTAARQALLGGNLLPSRLLQGELSVKTSNTRRALAASLTGLALAAITSISDAARDTASATQIAGPTEATQLVPAPPIAATRGSPLTLYIEDSSGAAFRLVRVQGTGWRYAAGWKSPESAAVSLWHKVSRPKTPARPAGEAIPDEEPLTVFIDGPSGFTFVWNQESGWKFVGKISDKSP